MNEWNLDHIKPPRVHSSLRAEQELPLDPAASNSQTVTCLLAQGLFVTDIGKLQGGVEFGDLSSGSWSAINSCVNVGASLLSWISFPSHWEQNETRWFLISFQISHV